MIAVTIEAPRPDENPVLSGLYVLRRLRAAGVPVIGVLWPMAVESGALSVESPDLADGSVVWRWSDTK